jgi:hypothetical protein
MPGHPGQPISGTLRRLVLAILGLFLWPLAAMACPVCAPGAAPGALEAIQQAERVVLARLSAEGQPRLSVVIKGEGRVGDTLDLLIPTAGDALPVSHALVLTRSAVHGGWALLGILPEDRAPWLEALVRLPQADRQSTQDWVDHVQWFLPQLEDPEPLVADTAYGEIARAPYAAMRALRGRLDAARLRAWIAAPDKAARRPLYLLLLGLSGTAGDARKIEQEMSVQRAHGRTAQTAQTAQTATVDRARPDLSALTAAALELGGSSRLAWIEREWLLPPDRLDAQIQQVLLALSVHGTEGGRIARDEIVQVYLRFIEQRPALGGLVAQDLAAWGVWEATPAYARAILSPQIPIASRVAMAQYLRVSPHPAARAALLRALGRQ